jgi:hypothetical protein
MWLGWSGFGPKLFAAGQTCPTAIDDAAIGAPDGFPGSASHMIEAMR